MKWFPKNNRAVLPILIWIMMLLWMPLPALSEAREIKEEKTELPELHFLSNEDLLKQTQTVLNKASENFSTQMRGMYGVEVLLEEAQKKTAALTVPKKQPRISAEDTDTIKTAKADLDYAKARLDAFNLRLERVQAEKTLLDKHLSQLEAAKSAAEGFINAIDRLNLFLLEIKWRIEDNTLTPDKIPDSLDAEKLEKQKQELISLQNEFRQKAKTIRKEIEDTVSRIEEAKKSVVEAESVHVFVRKKYLQELKRKTIEDEYSGLTTERLLAQIPKLQEEKIWFKGAFNLSYRQFHNSQETVHQIQEHLERTLPPQTDQIFQTQAAMNAEEAEQTILAAEKIIAYHTEHIKMLRELSVSLQSLIRYGEVFEGDATVFNDHLFKMQVLAKILEDFAEKGKIKSEEIPENSSSDVLTAAGDETAKLVSETLTAIQKAREDMNQIDEQIKKSETVKKDTQEKLVHFKKTYESALQAQQWDAELKTLDAKDIVQRFQENIKKMEDSSTALKNVREAFENARIRTEEIRQKLKSLKDPLLRLAQDELSGEKQNILKTLYQFANIEFPTETGMTQSDDGSDNKSSSDKDAPLVTEAYQNLLSTRIRIISERQKQDHELLNHLNSLNQQIEQYIAVLTETGKLALQNYANAVELKKRLGRRELEDNDIPEGITEALKRDKVTQIETELAELMNYQTYVKQEIESLGKPDKTYEEFHTLLTGILDSVGKRIDILNDLKKLDQDFDRKPDALSKTDQTALEQEALRLSESEDKPAEFFIGFVPSERARKLTALLQAYYQEIIDLKNKQENLKSRKEKTEHLIRMTEDEKTAILNILPFVQKHAEQMESKKKEELVKIQAHLMPEKAEEILDRFETETGTRLSMLAPVVEKDKPDAIRKSADVLFNYHVEIVAANKWLRLFEQRLSSSGLGAEIGKYQDNLGSLAAKDSAIQRRIKHLTGHSQDELAALPPEEKPATETDKIRFSEGEIGRLRADRYKTCTQAALLALAKLSAIFIITVVLIWLINFFTGRRIRKEKEAGEKSNQTIVVYSLARTLFKIVIWMFSLIAVLHSMGFNIGAILAGLGIGGLAIAMAAKETLANMLGGVMIFLSRPFKVGDRIRIKGQPEEAIVGEIGIRSTRLETCHYHTVYTVPNSVFSESIIENITAWQGKYIREILTLSRKTSVKQMELALQLIREVLSNHKGVNEINRVILQCFDDYAYRIQYVYNISEFKNRNTVRSEVNLEIHRLFEENNIRLADLPVRLSGETKT